MKVTQKEMETMISQCTYICQSSLGRHLRCLPEAVLRAILVSGILAGLHHATGEPTKIEFSKPAGEK